jgi:transcriptional regulator with XRE-family HTH domain
MAELTGEAVLAQALSRASGSQAELAQLTEVAQATISRWIGGKSTPDVEGALRLARATYLPKREVLRAFGHDPDALGIYDEPVAHVDPESRAILDEINTLPVVFRPLLRTMISKLRELRANGAPAASSNGVATAEHGTSDADDDGLQGPLQVWNRHVRPALALAEASL